MIVTTCAVMRVFVHDPQRGTIAPPSLENAHDVEKPAPALGDRDAGWLAAQSSAATYTYPTNPTRDPEQMGRRRLA
jgi:hypothetical protein